MQLVGDGHGSALNWAAGANQGPMIQLTGPSKATVREFQMNLGQAADGILVTNADQPGSRVYADGMYIDDYGYAVLTEGLQNTAVDVLMAQGTAPRAAVPFVRATGAGPNVGTSRIGLWGGNPNPSASGAPLYQVTNGGRIVASGGWMESGFNGLVSASDSGSITLNAMHFAAITSPAGGDNVTVNNFNGMVTILGVDMWNSPSYRGINIIGENSNTQGLFLANTNDMLSGGTFFNRPSSGGTLAFLNNKTGVNAGTPGMQASDCGNGFACGNSALEPPPAAFTRAALKDFRTILPQPLTGSGAGITDVRMYRVHMTSSLNGIHVTH